MFQITLERLAEFMNAPDITIRMVRRCSVCQNAHVEHMIITPGCTVYACNDCAEAAKKLVTNMPK